LKSKYGKNSNIPMVQKRTQFMVSEVEITNPNFTHQSVWWANPTHKKSPAFQQG
jgi:hypothetical protein